MKTHQKESFEALTLPHTSALFGAAVRLTQNTGDAEDLVQETFLRAFRFWSSFREDSSVKAWLFKIQTNLFLTRYKRKKRHTQILNDAKDEQQALDGVLYHQTAYQHQTPDRAYQASHLSKPVEEALYSLAEDFRMVVVLCDVFGFSYKEISKMLECPVGTVMSRLYRARKQLKIYLELHAKDIVHLEDYRNVRDQKA